jgi:hypothetical protein
MRNVLIEGPSSEPISLATAKQHLRLETDDDDTIVTDLITSARTYFEVTTGLALIEQTWRLTFDQFPSEERDDWWDGVREGSLSQLYGSRRYIELPTSPLLSVDTFNSYNEGDDASAFTDFYTDTNSRPGRVALRSGSVWPIASRGVNNYTIDYTAGFGADEAAVPADIKIAIRQIVAHWYENREVMLSTDIAQSEVPMSAMSIIRRRTVRKL